MAILSKYSVSHDSNRTRNDPFPVRSIESIFVLGRKVTFGLVRMIRSNVPTMLLLESDSGNIRPFASVLSGVPCSSNHSAVFLLENFPKACLAHSLQRGYFAKKSFPLNAPFVTLQRPPPVIRTFFPIASLDSMRCISPS